MISELDIWRAAKLLIERHGGERAQVVALERHAAMLVREDIEGAEMWSRIRQAIKELLAPPVGRAH